MSLTVKAYLVRKGEDKQEIRRFSVPADVSSSFSYLQKKVSDIYPTLKQDNFNLFWTDPEGDQIAFSTDDELVEALGFVEDGLFRITINENTKRTPECGENNVRHPGVVCDGCEGPVCGMRYKCVTCPDYDLCGTCEKKGLHTEHDMRKIPSPVQGPFEGFGCPPPPPYGQAGPGFAPPPQFRRWMQRYMKKWHNKHQAGCGDQEEDHKEGETIPEDEYLRNVGESVQAMLDPFGIDVAVDIEHNGQRKRCGRGGSRGRCGRGGRPQSAPGHHGQFPGCSFGFGAWGAPPTKEKTETKKQDDTPPTKEPETAKPKEMEVPMTTDDNKGGSMKDSTKKSQDGEDWTILTESAEASGPKPRPEVPQPTIPNDTIVYPPTDPRICEALNTMMGMGFHNEGGWLTTLLNEKEGDICKALDAIQQRRNRTSDGGYMA